MSMSEWRKLDESCLLVHKVHRGKGYWGSGGYCCCYCSLVLVTCQVRRLDVQRWIQGTGPYSTQILRQPPEVFLEYSCTKLFCHFLSSSVSRSVSFYLSVSCPVSFWDTTIIQNLQSCRTTNISLLSIVFPPLPFPEAYLHTKRSSYCPLLCVHMLVNKFCFVCVYCVCGGSE